MSRFIESLAFEGGTYPLIKWHQQRLVETFEAFFPKMRPLNLAEILPVIDSGDLHKVRLVYDGKNYQTEYASYLRPKIKTIKIVSAKDVDYRFKYEDRSLLSRLYTQRGIADDVLICVDGKITDTYYTNVCFWDGQHWYTPHTYLLNGVMRQKLLSESKITEREIKVSEIQNYKKASLINALNPLGCIEIPTTEIYL
jgi:4-amino-4-deoxychorismate lyase